MATLLCGEGASGSGMLTIQIPFDMPRRKRVLVIAVADISGSMAGRPWQQVKEALLDIVAETEQQGESCRLEIIVYNGQAKQLVRTSGSLKAAVQATSASGSTDFPKAFDLLRALVSAVQDEEEIEIMFMTDGQDTTSAELLAQGLQKLTDCLRKCPLPNRVHTVGFSNAHNLELLKKLQTAGRSEGVYGFVQGSDGLSALKAKMDDVYQVVRQLANQVEMVPELHGLECMSKVPTTARVIGSGLCEMRMWVKFKSTSTSGSSSSAEKEASVTMHLPSGETLEMPVCQRQASGPREESMLMLEGLRERILAASRVVAEFMERKAEMGAATKPMTDNIVALQTELKRLTIFGKHKAPRETRVELFETKGELQKIMDNMHRALAEYASASQRDGVGIQARANEIRHAGLFSSAGRQRRIDQRIAGNVALGVDFEQELRKLHAAAQAGTQAPSSASTIAASDLFTCTLSLMSMADVMEDPCEVMGFCLAAERPEHVVDAPTMMRIEGVTTTFCTKSSMEDAIKYHLSTDVFKMTFTDVGSIVVGRGREPINSWVPLYISQAHWARVAILMKPILGYLVCLDPLAYNKEQLLCFFAILGHMVARLNKKSVAERELALVFAFLRTARQVAIDFDLMETIVQKVADFMASPANRTKDVINNLNTFYGFLCVLDPSERAKIDKKKLALTMAAESMRRAAGVLLHSRSDSTVLELVNRCVRPSRATATAVTTEEAEAALFCQAVHVDDAAFDAEKRLRAEGAFASLQYNAQSQVQPQGRGSQQHSPLAAFDKRTTAALVTFGQLQCNQVPGPNIKEKEEKATQLAQAWYDSLITTPAEAAAQPSADTSADLSLATTRDMLNTMAEIEGHMMTVCAADLAGQTSVITLLGVLDQLTVSDGGSGENDASSMWKTLDDNGGEPPAAWIAVTKAAYHAGTEIVSPFQLVKQVVDEEAAAVACYRAALVQMVKFHRNRDAHVQGAMQDVFTDAQAVSVLTKAWEELQAFESKAMLAIEEYKRWQTANRYMVETADMYVFVGILALTHKDRTAGFNDLLDMLMASQQAVPNALEKLTVLIKGTFHDKAVFARGNVWMPSNVDMRNSMARLVGRDKFDELEMQVRSKVLVHVYRDSDIPNRHGSCNSNPHDYYGCALCQASGFSKRWR